MPKTFIVAEAGVNHNGSLDMAFELIDLAAQAGVDAVKFQTFQSESVVGKFAPKAEYQVASTGKDETQLEMVRKLELSRSDHYQLVSHCKQNDVRFLSTPFDEESARFLVAELDVPTVKISSGDVNNAPLLLEISRLGRPVILSTGMSTLGEIEMALGVLAYGYLGKTAAPSESHFRDTFAEAKGQEILFERASLLHCTTEYPAPFDQINLRVMDAMTAAFGLPVGLSDHTPGIVVPIAAVARGAAIIEKHFTLDKALPGPDHRASLDPDELKSMVEGIRQVESALGSMRKIPVPTEWKNRAIARRSLIASLPVSAGTPWDQSNIACKRPGTGVSPMRYWEYIGLRANRDYQADEPLDDIGVEPSYGQG